MSKFQKYLFILLTLFFIPSINLTASDNSLVTSLLPSSWVEYLEIVFSNIHYFEYCLAFVVILITLLFRTFIIKVVFSQLKVFAEKTEVEYDDRLVQCLEKPAAWLIKIAGIYIALKILPLDKIYSPSLNIAFKGLTLLLAFWAVFRTSDVIFDALNDVSAKKGSSFAGFVPLLKKTVRIFIFLLGGTIVLDNMGYSISGVIAGLGIGGAALAFASKDTIANFYGSIALAADRPFKVGDWIQVGDKLDGDVESIGMRSTRIRTFPKTVMSIPNAVLANETINNWTRMPKRRVKQIIGVTYETTPEKMEDLIEEIRTLLKEDENVNQDFFLVNFTDFGASSLDIMVYYFTKTTDWKKYLDIRQRINIKIMKAVNKHGLSIAFPSRTLYLDGDVARKMANFNDGSLPNDFGSDIPS